MISKASSLRFIRSDSQLPSFDNTLFEDVHMPGMMRTGYTQKLYTDDTVTVQVKVTSGQTIDLYYSQNCYGAWTKLSSGTKEGDYTTYDYWEVAISMATFAAFNTVCFKLNVLESGGSLAETWFSEPVELLSEDDPDLLQIEFFNQENAFEVDYTTEISHLLRVEADMNQYKPGGESSVFDNQDEVTKISDYVKRIFVMKTNPIPAYLAEMLTVAVAHDRFYVNEIEYVAEEKPEVEQAGEAYIWSCNLTQRSVIGLNTHDVGFDVDSITSEEMIHYRDDAASGAKTYSVPEGYMVAYITGYRTAGSPVIKAGRTVGGDDILYGMALNATDPIYEVAHIGQEIDPTGDGTLYVDISGAGATANIDILLIYNRQS